MSSDKEKKNIPTTLIDQYRDLLNSIYIRNNAPSFPIPGDIGYSYHRSDADFFFKLVRILYDQNPDPMRRAIVDCFNEPVEHEVCSWSGKITDGVESRDQVGLTRYQVKTAQKLYFTVYLARSLEDKILMNEVYFSLMTNKLHSEFFVVRNHYSEANLLFGLAPDAIKKQILDRILSDTKAHYPKKHGEHTGEFISAILRIVSDMNSRDSYYLKFFVKNYSIKERAVMFKNMMSYWDSRKISNDMYVYEDMVEKLVNIQDFHPNVKQYLEKVTVDIFSNVTLDKIKSSSRVFYNLKKCSDEMKQMIVSKIYVKCKKEDVNFFDFVKEHKKYLGENNIDRLRNFT